MHRTQTRHVTVEAHRESVRQLLAPLRTPDRIEQLPLLAALGRGLAADVVAPLDLPPFANSQMDGFAIRSADVPDDGAELRVVAPVPAGAAPPNWPRHRRPDHDRRHDAARSGRRRPDRTGRSPILPRPACRPRSGSRRPRRVLHPRRGRRHPHVGSWRLRPGPAWGPGSWDCSPRSESPRSRAPGSADPPGRRRRRSRGARDAPGPGKIYDSNATLLESSMRQAGLHVHGPLFPADRRTNSPACCAGTPRTWT